MVSVEPKEVTSKLINSYGLVDFTFNLMMMVAVSYYAYFLTDIAYDKCGFYGNNSINSTYL